MKCAQFLFRRPRDFFFIFEHLKDLYIYSVVFGGLGSGLLCVFLLIKVLGDLNAYILVT